MPARRALDVFIKCSNRPSGLNIPHIQTMRVPVHQEGSVTRKRKSIHIGSVPCQFARRSFEALLSSTKRENALTCSNRQQVFLWRPGERLYRPFHPNMIQHIRSEKTCKEQYSATLSCQTKQECGPGRTGGCRKAVVPVDAVFHFCRPAPFKAKSIQRANPVGGARHRESAFVSPFRGMYWFFVIADGEPCLSSAQHLPHTDRSIQRAGHDELCLRVPSNSGYLC